MRRITDETLNRIGSLVARDNAALGLIIDTRYEVRERIARGGMGEIFYAWDKRLDRPVAMKILAAHIGGPHWRARFEVEAKTLTRLEHPGVVPIHDLGMLPDERLYYTMKYVEGRTLEDLMKDEPGRERLVRILEGVCEVVQHAHERGVVHRDLKPANVMVDEKGHVYVLDWGIARVMEEVRGACGERGAMGGGMTSAGMVMGTIAYMPPEQARGDVTAIDERSDVFALGAILYEILTGMPPVIGTGATEMLERAVEGRVEAPRKQDPAISEDLEAICLKDLEAICLKALEADPARRYASAKVLEADLKSFREGLPVEARPLGATAGFVRRLKRYPRVSIAAVAGVLLGGVLTGIGLTASARAAEREKARGAMAVRMKGQEEALKLLEVARPALDKAFRYLYDKEANYEELVRRVEVGQRLIEEAVAKALDLSVGHYLLGRAWDIRGYWDKAESSWRRAIELDPGFSSARFELGRMLIVRSYLATLGTSEDDPEARYSESKRLAQEATTQIGAAMVQGNSFESVLQKEVAGAMLAYAQGNDTDVLRIVEKGIETYRESEGAEDFYWLKALVLSGNDRFESLDQAIRLRPKHFLAFLTYAVERHRDGDLDGADRDYAKALQINPNFPLIYSNRAIIRIFKDDLEGAYADANKAILLDPYFAPGYAGRGLALVLQGRYDAAGSDFDRFIALRPDDPIGYATHAMVSLRMNDLTGAGAYLVQAFERSSKCARAYCVRGYLSSQKKDYEAARMDFEEALRLDPKMWEARIGRGYVHLDRKDYTAALAEFNETLRLHSYARVHMGRGIAYYELGDLDAAWRDLEQVLAQTPNESQVHYYRGKIRRKRNELDGAIVDYTEAIRLDPNDSDAWYGRGVARYYRRDWEGAIVDYTEALRLDPSAGAYSNRGLARLDRGDVAGALSDMDEAIRLNPKLAEAYFNRALVHRAKDDSDHALSDCTEAIRLNSDDAKGRTLRGYLWKKKGDFARALADFDEVIRVNPAYHDAWYHRGLTRKAMGGLKDAVRDFDEAIRLNPRSYEAYAGRAEAYWEEGKPGEAAADYEKALEVASPDWSLRSEIEAKVKGVRTALKR